MKKVFVLTAEIPNKKLGIQQPVVAVFNSESLAMQAALALNGTIKSIKETSIYESLDEFLLKNEKFIG